MKTSASGRRVGSVSPLRRASQYALGTGIVLAIASAFGPLWIVRAGILCAIIGGVLAVRYAWREVTEQRTLHATELNRAAHARGAALSDERRRNAEVLESMRHHNEGADAALRRLETTVGALRSEINTLRGANAGLQADLIERDHRLKRLRADLATREAELRALQDLNDEAEVLAMPRHAAGSSEWDALPTAEELFATGDHPTVVDLQKLAFPTSTQQTRKQA